MRYRDLETGTFLTRDPIGYADGPNVYCYVHCNPITHFDVLGLADVVVVPHPDTIPKGNKLYDRADRLAGKVWESKARRDSNIKIIWAKSVSDAKKKIIEYQKGEGHTVDNLTFDGHGSPGSLSIGGRRAPRDDSHLTTENMEEFYDGIEIEPGGEVEYIGCKVGKGKKGDQFLEKSASETGRKSKAYTENVTWGKTWGRWRLEARGPNPLFPNGRDDAVDLGRADKYKKEKEPLSEEKADKPQLDTPDPNTKDKK